MSIIRNKRAISLDHQKKIHDLNTIFRCFGATHNQSVIITNISPKYLTKKTFYCLSISTSALTFSYKKRKKILRIKLNITHMTLSLNNKPASNAVFPKLISFLNRALSDLSQNKATIYKPKKGGREK